MVFHFLAEAHKVSQLSKESTSLHCAWIQTDTGHLIIVENINECNVANATGGNERLPHEEALDAICIQKHPEMKSSFSG